jgi:phosphatidylglycerophosphatase A
MKKGISILLATVFYIGYLPGARGTYASIATTAVYFVSYRAFHHIMPAIHLGFVCLITIGGTAAANVVSKYYGQNDPQVVVIDEVAGQLLTFLFLPVTWVNICLGTLLFRTFDIWKPFPIRKSEDLEHGVGIMADDLVAGVYANLVLHLVGWLNVNLPPGIFSWLFH